MATYRWTGIASGVFTNKANWIDLATGVASIVDPANSDTFLIDSGNVDVAAEVTGLTGCTIKVGEKYTGTIAPGGTLDINLTLLEHFGHAGNYGGSITTAVVEAQGSSVVNFNPSGAETLSDLTAYDSNVNVRAAMVLTAIQQEGGDVIAEANATGITTALIESGTFRSYRDVQIRLGRMAYGHIEGTAAKILTGSSVGPGGELYYKTSVDLASSAEVEVRRNGLLDFTQCANTFNARTINRWRGSRVNYTTLNGDPTYTENVYGRDNKVGGFVPLP